VIEKVPTITTRASQPTGFYVTLCKNTQYILLLYIYDYVEFEGYNIELWRHVVVLIDLPKSALLEMHVLWEYL
jgi:hypothetical protein